MYRCSKCNLEVVVLSDGTKIRACKKECSNATIIMSMESTMIGNTLMKLKTEK